MNGQPVRRDEIIRVRMLTEPAYERVAWDKWDWTETGEFEWTPARTEQAKAEDSDEKYLVDLEGLKVELRKLERFQDKVDQIVTRILNFRKVFLILPTGEVLTS